MSCISEKEELNSDKPSTSAASIPSLNSIPDTPSLTHHTKMLATNLTCQTDKSISSPSKSSSRAKSHSPIRRTETPPFATRPSSVPPEKSPFLSPSVEKSPFPRDFSTPLCIHDDDQASPMSEASVQYSHPASRSVSQSPLTTATRPLLEDKKETPSQRHRSQSHPQTMSPSKNKSSYRKRSRSESGGSVSSVTWNRLSGFTSTQQQLDRMDVDDNIPLDAHQSVNPPEQINQESSKANSPSVESADSNTKSLENEDSALKENEKPPKSESVNDREGQVQEPPSEAKPVRKRGPGRPPGSRNRNSTTWESAQITKLKEFETRKKPVAKLPRKPKKKQEVSSASESSSSGESENERRNSIKKEEEGIMLPDRKRVLPFSAINHPDRSGRTAIYKYAMTGDATSCKRLIEAGARLNLRDHAGWTPLHEACLNGHLDCAEIILAAGANINAPGGDMDTPLHDAAQNGHFEIVEFLLAHGASPLSLNAKKETPIDVADESVKSFLEKWEQTMEDILKKDETGRCSLHFACEKGDVAAVKKCLQYGADVNSADYAGWTPLHEAALHGHSECLALLLEYGANANVAGYQQETPLMDAVAHGHSECVQLLLQYGAHPHQKNEQESTAFDCLNTIVSSDVKQVILDMLNKTDSVVRKRPRFVSRPVSVSDYDSGPHTPRHIRSHSIGSDSTQSAFSHHRKKKNDLFPWWGNLNENEGEFSSTREERKFKALLKSLETSGSSPSGKSITKKRKIYGQVTYSEDEGGFDIVAAADGEGLVCKERAPRRASSSGRDVSHEASASGSPTQTPVVKRKRGRPRKNRDEQGAPSTKRESSSDEEEKSKPKSSKKEKSIPVKSRSVSPVAIKKAKVVKEEKVKEKPKPSAQEGSSSKTVVPEDKTKIPVKEEKPDKLSESAKLALAEQKEEMEKKAKAKEKEMAVHSAAVAAAAALKRASVGETSGDKSPIRKKPKLFQGLGGYVNADLKSPETPLLDSKDDKKEERRVSTGKPVMTALDKERDTAAIQSVFNSLNPDVALKKGKKKNWMGLSSDDTPLSPEAIKRKSILEQAIETLKKRRCIPLYVVTLPVEQGSSKLERYLVDLQVGLCLGLKSGRALLEKYPEMSRRLATAAEKSSLEISPVAESILNCMMGKRGDSVIPKWIKWVMTSSGGKGLKLTDVDIHFIPEAEAIKRISPAWMAEGTTHTVPIYGDGKPVFETTEPIKLPDRILTLDMDLSKYPSKLTAEDRTSMDSSIGNQSPSLSDSTRRDSTLSTRTDDIPPLPHRDSASSLISTSPISATAPSGPSSDAAYYLHKLKRPPKKQFVHPAAGQKRSSAAIEEPHEVYSDNDSGPSSLAMSNRGGKGKAKIDIRYIEDKNKRHITFSKRKAGIMKKAYELSTLTGTQVLLLVASETGHVYTFATPKLQPLITRSEGKNLIQECLNTPDPNANQAQQEPEPQESLEKEGESIQEFDKQASEITAPHAGLAGEASNSLSHPNGNGSYLRRPSVGLTHLD